MNHFYSLIQSITLNDMTMLAESNFILHLCTIKSPTSSTFNDSKGNSYHALEKCEGVKEPEPIELLKNEAIDRLASVVGGLPKYKNKLEELIVNFTVDDMLYLINTIYRDQDFKCSLYYTVYNEYFDEIEELIHKELIHKSI